MKKLFFFLFFTVSMLNAQVTLIPDANFEQALIDSNIDSDNTVNGQVLNSDIEDVRTLTLTSRNISTLEGIEGFIALEGLDISTNNLTNINLSNNTNLRSLDVSSNFLTSLNISTNTALTHLNCFDNELENLDVSNQPLLRLLTCQNNNLESLDVSNNTDLYYFFCFQNNFTSLDISNNTTLTHFRCSQNNLQTLDVSNQPLLADFSCHSNELISLNLTNKESTSLFPHLFNNPNLTCIEVDDVVFSTANWTSKDAIASFSLDCQSVARTYVPDINFEQALIDLGYDDVLDHYVITANINSILSLTIGNLNISDLRGIEDFIALESLYCENNPLNTIDISSNINLVSLYISNTDILNIDITFNTSLEILYCNNTAINFLDISNNSNLKSLFISNTALTEIDLTNNIILETLYLNENSITELNVSHIFGLEYLQFSNTNISNIDLSNNVNLKSLVLDNSLVSVLDVSTNIELLELSFNNTSINEISLLNNEKLRILSSNRTDLIELNLSNNVDLIDFSSSSTDLEVLNIKNGVNTLISNFQVTNNPNLTCIEVDDVVFSTANWTSIDNHTSFSEDCESIPTLSLNTEIEQIILIYPNPVRYILNINSNDIFNYQLINAVGLVILQGKSTTIDVSVLPVGIYYLQLNLEDRTYYQKVLIE